MQIDLERYRVKGKRCRTVCTLQYVQSFLYLLELIQNSDKYLMSFSTNSIICIISGTVILILITGSIFLLLCMPDNL